MAIAAPSDEVIRLVEALGLRTKNTREVTLRMAVNEAVVVNTVEYVNGEQIDALASELKERQYRLSRWIPVEERLPPLLTEVLGWHPDDRVRAWFRHSGQPKNAPYWELWSPQDRECDDCEVDEPTHWMPLPEPPMSQSIEERIRDHVCDTLGIKRGQVAEPASEGVVGLMPLPEPPEVK